MCCDYALHMAVTHWSEEVAAELPLVTQPDIGINSFKVFMAYKDVMMIRDGEIIECFKVTPSYLLSIYLWQKHKFATCSKHDTATGGDDKWQFF